MSERLTYRNSPNGEAYLKYGAEAKWRNMPRFDLIKNAMQKLAEYEDLEEQRLLLKLPCKVGDTVWFTYTNGKNRYGIEAHTIEKIVIADKFHQLRFTSGMVFTVWDKLWSYYIGKNLFLTKEEAEEALRKKVDE